MVLCFKRLFEGLKDICMILFFVRFLRKKIRAREKIIIIRFIYFLSQNFDFHSSKFRDKKYKFWLVIISTFIKF